MCFNYISRLITYGVPNNACMIAYELGRSRTAASNPGNNRLVNSRFHDAEPTRKEVCDTEINPQMKKKGARRTMRMIVTVSSDIWVC